MGLIRILFDEVVCIVRPVLGMNLKCFNVDVNQCLSLCSGACDPGGSSQSEPSTVCRHGFSASHHQGMGFSLFFCSDSWTGATVKHLLLNSGAYKCSLV